MSWLRVEHSLSRVEHNHSRVGHSQFRVTYSRPAVNQPGKPPEPMGEAQAVLTIFCGHVPLVCAAGQLQQWKFILD